MISLTGEVLVDREDRAFVTWAGPGQGEAEPVAGSWSRESRCQCD